MSPIYRRVLKVSRYLHLYSTFFGLALLLFFAITGFMLNHVEWFVEDDPPPRITEPRTLSTEKLHQGKYPAPNEANDEPTGEEKLGVVEALRKEFNIAGELVSFQFLTDEDEAGEKLELIQVEFRRAGETTIAKINRISGITTVSRKSKGWAGIITDLHRGNRGNVTGEVRFTGRIWSLVIDGTCILMLVISATGLVLWSSLKSRGKWGAVLLILGALGVFAVYYWWVP